MQYRTHLVTSLVITLPIMTFTDTLSIGTIAAVSIGALFPDIDEPHSWIGSRTRGISDLINKAFGHRGLTHSIIGLFITFLTILMMINFVKLPVLIGAYFILGYALHLAEDSFSKSGIKWLLPFNTRAFQSGMRILYYRTGSMTENLIFLCASVLLIVQITKLGSMDLFKNITSMIGI